MEQMTVVKLTITKEVPTLYPRTVPVRIRIYVRLLDMPPHARLSMFARQRAWYLLSEGNSISHVVTLLGIITTRQTVWHLERHVRTHGSIEALPKCGRPPKISNINMDAIDNAMEHDDETTGKELVALLERNGLSVSKRTVYRA